MEISVGIIGVSGYTGLELIRIILQHSVFKIKYIANSEGGQKISDLHPSLRGVFDLVVEKADAQEATKKCELIFLALPHKNSMEFAQKILENGVKVIDLSADYRLSQKNYEDNYAPHTDTKNLKHAIYGLTEYARDSIKNAALVANPGCYPTATLLGLLPFLPFLEEESVFVDAKSGVSGAGRTLTANTHYPYINENICSYSPFSHRHQIEIEEKCQVFGNKSLQVNLVPHLTPLTRGMLVSIFGRLKTNLDPLELLKNHYKNEDFIRIKESQVEVANVVGTHFCDIFALLRGRDFYINVAIDNLLRGASSQAVANANLMCGLQAHLALPRVSFK